ncbi:MAG TPA: Ig-like domain-containing protein, partial [Sphingobacteriaceae bacterium]
YDGTTLSQVHSFSYYNSEQASAIDLTYTGGNAYFLDDNSDYYGGYSEVFQANLVTGEKKTLSEIYGASYDVARHITAANGSIFFTRTLRDGKLTLWYYNPAAPPVVSECGADGFIQREKWNNVSGYAVSSIPVNTQPSSVDVLTDFIAPRNNGDSYGARIRGYVCAPETGNYVFYISSDDNSELWLSTDDDPANKRLIASSKWTNYNEWAKYPTQQSAEIALVKGTKYYIEALHKEAAGADHLSVGWKLPSGVLERPIAARRLSQFNRNIPPTITIYQPDDNAQFTAPASIPISAYGRDTEAPIAKVGFYNSGTLLFEDTTAPFSYTWENVPAGTYTIEARATDTGGFTASDFQTVIVEPGCNGTGIIYQEVWVNATGTDVRTFDFSTRPNSYGRSFNSFETTQYYANNYASRMRAYLCVPQTGTYTFWISSDDSSELYLSTDDSETNKRLIAWVYGATPFRNYDKYPSQKSVQITLQAGHRYYIEARHKEGSGNDFVSVGWQLPNGTLERPIAGNHLIGIEPQRNAPTYINITSPQPNQNFTSSTVNISADITDADGIEEVRFTVLYGNTVTELARFTAPPYEYQWTNVPSGSYQLNVSADDTRNSTTVDIVFFSVQNSACQGTGTIVREIWTGIPGTSVSAIPLTSPP